MSRKQEGQRVDIYTRITERIVEDLAKGVRPWMKPWNAANADRRITRPLRHNGQPYTGMNTLLVWSEGVARGFSSPMWMTFKQALELGAAVRKGESGATVVFTSRFTKSEDDGRGGEVEREVPFLKAYTVFNIEQIDGLPDHYHHRPAPFLDPVERIEEWRSLLPQYRRGDPAWRRSGLLLAVRRPYPDAELRDVSGCGELLCHAQP